MRIQVANKQLSLDLDQKVFCIYCRRNAGQFVDGHFECTRSGERTLFTRRIEEELARAEHERNGGNGHGTAK